MHLNLRCLPDVSTEKQCANSGKPDHHITSLYVQVFQGLWNYGEPEYRTPNFRNGYRGSCCTRDLLFAHDLLSVLLVPGLCNKEKIGYLLKSIFLDLFLPFACIPFLPFLNTFTNLSLHILYKKCFLICVVSPELCKLSLICWLKNSLYKSACTSFRGFPRRAAPSTWKHKNCRVRQEATHQISVEQHENIPI